MWIVVGALVVGVAGGVTAAPAQDSPESVVMHVGLETDGNASWRIEYRYRLDDDESEAAFESLRADIRNDSETYEERFADRMRPTLQEAENATGREMALLTVTVSTERVQLPQEYGVVVYRFEWTGFAAVGGGRLRAGDALDGLFLDEGTALSVTWPDGYHAAGVSPPPDRQEARTVYWTGPREFGAGEPRVELAPGTPPADDGDTTAPAAAESAGWLSGLPPVLLGVLALVGLGAVLAVATRRGAGDDGAGDAAADLRTNEERVLDLLAERGGRLKQQEVAAALGWTDAKTSKVVRGLREDGEVEVVRVGRENVVALPGEIDV